MNSKIYSKPISDLKSYLDDSNKYITYPKFVFLCGKSFSDSEYENTNRGILDKFLKSKSNDVFVILSEKLWEDSFDSNIDLLTFEEFLAEVSDLIILFVESPGSFCELGAFAYAEKMFSDKLVIVIDEKRKGDKSFIIKGPTAKAAKDGATILYAPLSGTGLLSCADLRKNANQWIANFSSKSMPCNKRKPNGATVLVNTFILEMLELLRVVQPVSRKDLLDIYKEIKGFSSFSFVKKDGNGFHNEIKFDYVLKLLATVKIINLNDDIITTDLYNRSQPLMFRWTNLNENRERNRLICRKFRYGDM